MKVTITEKQDNALLQRLEISGNVEFEGATPSNNDVAAEIASQVKSDGSLVVVKHIYTQFSTQTAKFDAVVYATAEARAKAEMSTKHLRKKAEEAAKAAAEAKKAEAEAAPKEEEAPAAEESPAEEAKEAEPDESTEPDAKEEVEVEA